MITQNTALAYLHPQVDRKPSPSLGRIGFVGLPVEYPGFLQNIPQIDVSIQEVWVKGHSLRKLTTSIRGLLLDQLTLFPTEAKVILKSHLKAVSLGSLFHLIF